MAAATATPSTYLDVTGADNSNYGNDVAGIHIDATIHPPGSPDVPEV